MTMDKKKTKSKMGRPPIDNPLNARLPEIRVTVAQAKRFKAAAKKQGLTFGAWARELFEKASR